MPLGGGAPKRGDTGGLCPYAKDKSETEPNSPIRFLGRRDKPPLQPEIVANRSKTRALRGIGLLIQQSFASASLARIRNNPVLNRLAEPHLNKPADLAPGEVRTVFHEHEYQAGNWSCQRRVALVVTFSERELFPRYFWLITSLAREVFGAEELLARYLVRSKAENTFGELKSTLRAQLPSTPRPKRQYAGKTIERSDLPAETEWRPQNEALLLLALLAYQIMHEGRCAMQDASGKGWSLGTFREKVLRAACRVIWNARRMKFYIARSVASHWAILLQRLKKSAMQDA